MTREEAIERMKTMRWEHATNPCPDRTAFDMAISALSTEGEYIKKSELLQHVTTEVLSDYQDCDVIHAEVIDSLQTYSFPDSDENKGEWIYKNPFDTLPYCSKCDKEPDVEFLGILPNTCPNCGADMRGDKAE